MLQSLDTGDPWTQLRIARAFGKQHVGFRRIIRIFVDVPEDRFNAWKLQLVDEILPGEQNTSCHAKNVLSIAKTIVSGG